MDNQLINDLRQTRREIEVRGRCHGRLINSQGNVCLDGAVALATGITINTTGMGIDELDESSRAQAVLRALADQIWQLDCWATLRREVTVRAAVYLYNDHPETSDKDCFNLIDKALAEAGGLW